VSVGVSRGIGQALNICREAPLLWAWRGEESGKWRLRVPVEEIGLEASQNLHQLIELQIDRLGERERRVLEAASAVGDPFSTVVCAAAAAMEVEECEDLLNGLSRRSYMVRLGDRQRFPNGAVSACPISGSAVSAAMCRSPSETSPGN
jgi:hypothetical protein